MTVTDSFTTNTDGRFFKLGSLTTTGIDSISGEIDYEITGNLQASLLDH